MAECINHPGVQTEQACATCGRPFCDNCLVDMGGRKFCGFCKNSQVRDAQRVENYKLPGEALTYSIVGLFCCGIILEPMALMKANQALKEIDANPSLPGRDKANAARIISIIGIVLWVIGVIFRIAGAVSGVNS